VSASERPPGRAGLGWTGERLAAEALTGAGYTVIDQRWRCSTGEIDLVVRDGATLVIVEVRTRRGDQRGAAVESITTAKAARLVRLATLYLQAHPELGEPDWRIDVVAVQLDGQGRRLAIDHIISAIEN
jgi:putative endonuclease